MADKRFKIAALCGDDRFFGCVQAEEGGLAREDFEDALTGARIAIECCGAQGGVEFFEASELDGSLGGAAILEALAFGVALDEVIDEPGGAIEFGGDDVVRDALRGEGEGLACCGWDAVERISECGHC